MFDNSDHKPPIERWQSSMIAPCGWGLHNELWGAGNRSNTELRAHHLAVHNLPPDPLEAYHEDAHLATIIILSSPPNSEAMREKMYSAIYQYNLYMENFVEAFGDVLLGQENQNNPDYSLASYRKSLMNSLSNRYNRNMKVIEEDYTQGQKGAFFLGKHSDPPRTIFDIRHEFSSQDEEIFHAALNRARELGFDEDTVLRDTQHGDYYLAAGQRQTYFDMGDFLEDPDLDVMIERGAHILAANAKMFPKGTQVSSFHENFHPAEMYCAVRDSLTPEEKQSPELIAFEKGFFAQPLDFNPGNTPVPPEI